MTDDYISTLALYLQYMNDRLDAGLIDFNTYNLTVDKLYEWQDVAKERCLL